VGVNIFLRRFWLSKEADETPVLHNYPVKKAFSTQVNPLQKIKVVFSLFSLGKERDC
jgi:hypothetical protein